MILVPDVGMIGYLLNPKAGAWIYNLFHHRGIAILLYLLGVFAATPVLLLAGVILLGHASMDRLFGFGLKYPDSFHHTHLDLVNSKQ